MDLPPSLNSHGPVKFTRLSQTYEPLCMYLLIGRADPLREPNTLLQAITLHLEIQNEIMRVCSHFNEFVLHRHDIIDHIEKETRYNWDLTTPIINGQIESCFSTSAALWCRSQTEVFSHRQSSEDVNDT